MFFHSFHKQYDERIHFLNIGANNHSNLYHRDNFKLSSNLGTYTFDDIENNFFSKSKYSGPFPLAVRAISSYMYLIERPPFQIKIDYSPTYSSRLRRPIKPVTIWIPWTVCIIDTNNYQNTRLFFNDGPLQSLDEELIYPWTSNVFKDGKLCMGKSSDYAFNGAKEMDLQTWYSNFMNEYFFGGWNQDISNYGTHVYHFVSPELFPYVYSSDSISKLDSSIVKKIQSSKMRFYSDKYWSFRQSNIYYNFSLLSLDQTLQFAKDLKEKYNDSKIKLSSFINQCNKDYLSLSHLESKTSFNIKGKFPMMVDVCFDNTTSIYREENRPPYQFNNLYSNFRNSFIDKYFPNLNYEKLVLFQTCFQNCFNHISEQNVYNVLVNEMEKIVDASVLNLNQGLFHTQYDISYPITPTADEIYECMMQTLIVKDHFSKQELQI